MKRKTLVIGDVHGCADELRQLLELAGDVRVFLVGDLFTKGPKPVQVWSLLKAHRARSVMGNHDWRLLQCIEGARPNDAHGAAVCAELDRADPAWRAFVGELPLFRKTRKHLITHAALHPSGSTELTDRFTHMLRRRWPGDNRSDSPVWWESYTGPPVIFGHDAKRGLVLRERQGKPWLVGLDTGCVYGGALSGWIIEEQRLLQVPAAQVYRAIG
ncbi:MAG: metallophosphoesterase [Myxococcota bacterium]